MPLNALDDWNFSVGLFTMQRWVELEELIGYVLRFSELKPGKMLSSLKAF